MHFTAVAVDLQRQREVWLRAGAVGRDPRLVRDPRAVHAAHLHGRELVDGGLLAPLPIAATRLSDAHRLIAVDMHGWPGRAGRLASPAATTSPVTKPETARIAPARWLGGALVDQKADRSAWCRDSRTTVTSAYRGDVAFARHHAGADLARAAGAGSAGTGDPDPARCLPVLRVLAGRGS